MEIGEYIRLAGKRIRIVVGVPLLALAVTAVLLWFRPPQYQAVATVVVPATEAVGSLIASVDQSVSDFEGAVRSDAVIARVSAATGLPKGAIQGTLSTQRVGASSLVEVSATAGRASTASAIAETVSEEALALIQQSVIGPLEEQRKLAEQSYEDAESALQAFISETGFIVPSQVFKIESSRLVALRDALGVARGKGDDAEARRLQEQIDSKVANLSEQVITYQRLEDDRQRALEALRQVDAAYYDATGSLAATEQGTAVTVSAPLRVPRLESMARQLIATLVVAVALGLALVLLLEALSSRGFRRGAPGLPEPPS